jgi:hypothetical protein
MNNQSNKPDFLVPGFPKCGTTWLYRRLSEIQDFKMPPHKELHFFNRNSDYNNGTAGEFYTYLKLRKSILRNFGLGGASFLTDYLRIWEPNDQLYLRLFGHLKGYSGDITPLYILLDHDGVKKMSKVLDGVPILFMMRDPIDRAWSQFRMYLRKTGSNIDDKSIDQIKSFFRHPLNKGRCDYQLGIENFTNNFNNSKIAIVFYDRLVEDPHLFLSEIIDFFGVKVDSQAIIDLNLKERNNVSKEIDIPIDIYEFLKEMLYAQYLWLKCATPSMGEYWYSLHYLKDNKKGLNIEKKSDIVYWQKI